MGSCWFRSFRVGTKTQLSQVLLARNESATCLTPSVKRVGFARYHAAQHEPGRTTMAELPPREEREQILDALAGWFQSQDISPSCAAFIMSTLIGRIISEIFGRDSDNWQMGIKILISEMTHEHNEQDFDY